MNTARHFSSRELCLAFAIQSCALGNESRAEPNTISGAMRKKTAQLAWLRILEKKRQHREQNSFFVFWRALLATRPCAAPVHLRATSRMRPTSSPGVGSELGRRAIARPAGPHAQPARRQQRVSRGNSSSELARAFCAATAMMTRRRHAKPSQQQRAHSRPARVQEGGARRLWVRGPSGRQSWGRCHDACGPVPEWQAIANDLDLPRIGYGDWEIRGTPRRRAHAVRGSPSGSSSPRHARARGASGSGKRRRRRRSTRNSGRGW